MAALMDCTMGDVWSTLWVGLLGLSLPSRPLLGENRLSAQGGTLWLLSPCTEGSFLPGLEAGFPLGSAFSMPPCMPILLLESFIPVYVSASRPSLWSN